MLRQWLSSAALLDLPVVAMCLFLLFFLVVLVRVCRRGARSYEAMARLPLQDDVAVGAANRAARRNLS